ncbi:hypothetical protein FSARC_6158 [Fusarium sarcochroum]|uniref:CHAT domain-containing protein n=1 Tax=Fusarium sarcochroum TaxID=1208366 RepID=A0A8H4X8R6_9HYPO|nr:hypothetical protein FSARC_6158 [Fusarium sarcochroum]
MPPDCTSPELDGHDKAMAHMEPTTESLLYSQYNNLIKQAYYTLEEAIQKAREAIEIAPLNSTIRAELLRDLSNMLRDQARHEGYQDSFDDAIAIMRQAVVEGPSDDLSQRLDYLYHLSDMLRTRHEKSENTIHVIESMAAAQDLLNNTPPDHPNRPGYLYHLSIVLASAGEQTGDIHRIDQAIISMREAIQKLPEDHPQRPEFIYFLAKMLLQQYAYADGAGDANEVLFVARQAVSLTPEDHVGFSKYLHQLGLALSHKYRFETKPEDLDEAIEMLDRATLRCCPEDTNQIERMSDLGLNLFDRYNLSGRSEDLIQSITLAKKVVDGTARASDQYFDVVHNLMIRLSCRSESLGCIADLDEAIELANRTRKIIPKNDASGRFVLHSLVDCLIDRWWRQGNKADTDETIRIARRAAEEIPENAIAQSEWFNKLGYGLYCRHLQTSNMDDLEEAIAKGEMAIQNLPEDSEHWLSSVSNLSKYFAKRYERLGSASDIRTSIEKAQESVQCAFEHHPQHISNCMDNINQIMVLCIESGSIVDQEFVDQSKDAGLVVQRKLKQDTPREHADWPQRAHQLAIHLGRRYKVSKDMKDLDEAIETAMEAADAVSEDDRQQSDYLLTAARFLQERLELTKAADDGDQFESVCLRALKQTQSFIPTRIEVAKGLISYYLVKEDHVQAFQITKLAVDLIPYLVMRSLEVSDMQELLYSIGGISSEAAALALRLGNDPADALDLLEKGRGIIASSLSDLYADTKSLGEACPDLAEQLSRLMGQMRGANPHIIEPENERARRNLESDSEAVGKYETSIKFDELLVNIRNQPGFDDFLFPATTSEIMQSASCGPIVVVNSGMSGNDAIIIEQDRIRSIPLPSLKRSTLIQHVQDGKLKSAGALEYLWHCIANPVLNALGFTQPPSNSRWPHMWWIMTGLLTAVPIHAAGLHSKHSGETVIDRVVSSYHTSVQSIIRTRKRPLAAVVKPEALLMAMENTPGGTRLPFASNEVYAVRALCRSMSLTVREPKPNKKDILEHLLNCQIFHFAGHGFADPHDPTQSYLQLAEEKSQSVTVDDLLKINLKESFPFLAYLSACSTSQIETHNLADESIHLVSAFQSSGFRHVIGTLWEVQDQTCVDVAKLTYEYIKKEGLVDQAIALGLHNALRLLRDRWIDRGGRTAKSSGHTREGEPNDQDSELECVESWRKIRASSDEAKGFWIPYIHYGI